MFSLKLGNDCCIYHLTGLLFLYVFMHTSPSTHTHTGELQVSFHCCGNILVFVSDTVSGEFLFVLEKGPGRGCKKGGINPRDWDGVSPCSRPILGRNQQVQTPASCFSLSVCRTAGRKGVIPPRRQRRGVLRVSERVDESPH